MTPSTLSNSTNMVHSKNCTPYFKFVSLQSDKEGLLKHIAQQKAFYRVSKQTLAVNALIRDVPILYSYSVDRLILVYKYLVFSIESV